MGICRLIVRSCHCERSEAIHIAATKVWIASSLALLAMTAAGMEFGVRASVSRETGVSAKAAALSDGRTGEVGMGICRLIVRTRHCERSEAIHVTAQKVWIASSLALLAMTAAGMEFGIRASVSRET